MSVYRRNYVIAGKRRTSRYYLAEFQGPAGLVRRTTRCTTRRAAEAFEKELREQEELRAAGVVDEKQAKRRYAEHVEDFCAYLDAELKRDADYVRIARHRLLKVGRDAGWLTLSDITLNEFEAWRRKQKTEAKTLNQFLDILRRFLSWCVRRGRCRHNPLVHAEKGRVLDNRDFRRAATPEEIGKLVASVPADRALFYQFAVYCPLRRETLQQLEWSDLHLYGDRPWVAIRAETIKDRKYIPLPLRPEVAAALDQQYAKVRAGGGNLVFPTVPSVAQIKADLAAAGVAFEDAQGKRRLDLHAFRRTALAWMKQAGVPLEDAAAILQHRDIRTTRRYYDEAPDAVATGAVARMPGLRGGGK